MRVIFTPGQVEDLLDHLEDLVARARDHQRQLRARQIEDHDGYPTNSMGGGGTPAGGHSDPTGRNVITRDQLTDPIGQALSLTIGHLANARHQLQVADGIATTALTPPTKVPADRSDLWCKSCLRANIHTPRTEGTGHYCRWCYDWMRSHNGEQPWVELLDLRQRGVRLTSARIAEVERARSNRRKTKRRKAKR